MNRSTPFGTLARRSPHAATERLVALLEQTGGNLSAVGRLLGLGRHQVWRYVVKFEVQEYVASARDAGPVSTRVDKKTV